MPSYKRSFLNEEEKERYSRRLSHFLEDFLFRTKLTHSEAAKKLGLSSNKFSQLKNGGEQGRFLSSLDYLKSIATLDGLGLRDFITYIEGIDDEPGEQPRYSWLDKLYKALDPISITHRKAFANACTAAATTQSDRVELMCRGATAMSEMDIRSLRHLIAYLEQSAEAAD